MKIWSWLGWDLIIQHADTLVDQLNEQIRESKRKNKMNKLEREREKKVNESEKKREEEGKMNKWKRN